MATFERARCPSCGRDCKTELLGLTPQGDFDPDNAQPNELSRRIDHIGGRGRLRVERVPLDARHALGIRAMLKHRLEQVENELREGGVEIPED